MNQSFLFLKVLKILILRFNKIIWVSAINVQVIYGCQETT